MSVVASYFTNVARPYWQWQDSGNVVAWTDGATIVFRAELFTVFRRMQTVSLPPFGSVVLLMAACREGWSDEPSKLGLLSGVLSTGGRKDRLELLNRVFEGLDRVRALPAALRTSPEAKAELAVTVFEAQVDPPSPGAYEMLIQGLDQGLGDLTAAKLQKVDVVDRLLRDLAWLDRGLASVQASTLALRVKTGIEQPVVPVELEVPVLGSARSLIAELQDDPELGGVARLAKLLSATVNLSRPLSLPEELPLGGVSDISNRGTLDRLLISELAYDDHTLSVRVAMNEALYLHREVPPRPPTRRRVILLDSGLRMWGVPRLFATSVGLALAAGADLDADVTVLRAAGTLPDEVDLTTAAGLTEHLAMLDARVHPGETLEALRAIVDDAEESIDVVVVTGKDVVADRTFQRALAEAGFENVHLAVVDRAGTFELHLQTRRGRKLLKQASFALDEILAPTNKPTVKLLDDSRNGLPAIFEWGHFPLRLSCPIDTDRSWYVKDRGAFSYTRDRRLLHWTSDARGGRQIAQDLPDGDLHWAVTRRPNDQGPLAVIGRLSRNGLHAIFVAFHEGESTVNVVKLEVQIEQPKIVFAHQGIVFVADVLNVNAIDPKTGALFATRSLAGLKHVHSRYYRFDRSNTILWKAIGFDGTEISLVEVYSEPNSSRQLVSMFEGDEFEGPCAVLKSGHLLNPATNTKRMVRHNRIMADATVVGVSRDGSRLALTGSAATKPFLIDVRTLLVSELRSPLPAALEPDLFATAKPIVMRHRFLGIGIDTAGRLTLVGRRDGYWPLEHEQATGSLRLHTQPNATKLRFQHRFEEFECRQVPHVLRLAKFDDGSRAMLDERGLLHLKSSDPSVPEITIVLTEGVGACWLSDDTICGSAYHFVTTTPPVAAATHVREVVARFMERLR